MAIREKAFQKVLPARGWRALLMRASFAFMKWLIPRPRLFAWLQVPPIVRLGAFAETQQDSSVACSSAFSLMSSVDLQFRCAFCCKCECVTVLPAPE